MTLDEARAFFRAEFPQAAEDFTLDAIAPMSATLRLTPGARHLRPGGTVSGPTLFALADVGFYLALMAMIGPKALAVTTNASIDFMRKPAAGQGLTCQAHLLKLGRVLAVGDALIFSEGTEAPVARASLTYSIPPAR